MWIFEVIIAEQTLFSKNKGGLPAPSFICYTTTSLSHDTPCPLHADIHSVSHPATIRNTLSCSSFSDIHAASAHRELIPKNKIPTQCYNIISSILNCNRKRSICNWIIRNNKLAFEFFHNFFIIIFPKLKKLSRIKNCLMLYKPYSCLRHCCSLSFLIPHSFYTVFIVSANKKVADFPLG